MIKGSLLKRIIALVLSTILISALLTSGIYILVAKNTFINIRAAEFLPTAQNIAAYIEGTWTGEINSETLPFFDSSFKVLDTQVHLYDKNGNLIKFNSTRSNLGVTDDSSNNSKSAQSQQKQKAIASGTTDTSNNTDDNKTQARISIHVFPISGQTKSNPSPTFFLSASLNQLTIAQTQNNESQSVLADVIPTVLKNNTVNTIKRSSEGNDYLVVSVPITVNNTVVGAVAFAKPIKEFTASINGLTTALFLSMLASFIVMLVPAYFASRRIVVPIRQMRDVSLAIAKGDYSARADESQKGEIGELAVALNKCSIESEHLEQTRRDYVANVSHELRTPIASIRAIAETLSDGLVKNEDKKSSFYNSILNESIRLSALVDDLLELSRLQSGITQFEKEVFSVYSLFKDSVEIHLERIKQFGLNFEFNIPKNTPKAYTNPARIEQVFVIILDNAIKHTKECGKISLSATWDEKKIKISVTDTGEGISPEDIDHIFDRFYKADKAHSSEGTGLGLSIANEIMTILDESISVQSEVDKGSTFTLTLTRA